jgi:hypothetical protein
MTTTQKQHRFDAVVDYVRRGLAAEFEASTELQAEFIDAGNYVAFVLSMPELTISKRASKVDFP